jgi:hypothetical protein
MTRYTFDPSRLRGTAKQQERAGYRVVAGMLFEYLGADLLADFRHQVRRDPVLHAATSRDTNSDRLTRAVTTSTGGRSRRLPESDAVRVSDLDPRG